MMNDIKRLKTETAATTAELREFVRGLKGRSPQEVMGMITGNALTRALVWATVGCAAALFALSVPFAFGSSVKAKAAKTKATETAKAVSEPTKADSKAGSSEGNTPSEADMKKASKAMGLDETKMADPKKNPLDNFDNLLDKVK